MSRGHFCTWQASTLGLDPVPADMRNDPSPSKKPATQRKSFKDNPLTGLAASTLNVLFSLFIRVLIHCGRIVVFGRRLEILFVGLRDGLPFDDRGMFKRFQVALSYVNWNSIPLRYIGLGTNGAADVDLLADREFERLERERATGLRGFDAGIEVPGVLGLGGDVLEAVDVLEHDVGGMRSGPL